MSVSELLSRGTCYEIWVNVGYPWPSTEQAPSYTIRALFNIDAVSAVFSESSTYVLSTIGSLITWKAFCYNRMEAKFFDKISARFCNERYFTGYWSKIFLPHKATHTIWLVIVFRAVLRVTASGVILCYKIFSSTFRSLGLLKLASFTQDQSPYANLPPHAQVILRTTTATTALLLV